MPFRHTQLLHPILKNHHAVLQAAQRAPACLACTSHASKRKAIQPWPPPPAPTRSQTRPTDNAETAHGVTQPSGSKAAVLRKAHPKLLTWARAFATGSPAKRHCYCYYKSGLNWPGSSCSCCIRNLHALVHKQCHPIHITTAHKILQPCSRT
jgi:hypothetical protein